MNENKEGKKEKKIEMTAKEMDILRKLVNYGIAELERKRKEESYDQDVRLIGNSFIEVIGPADKILQATPNQEITDKTIKNIYRFLRIINKDLPASLFLYKDGKKNNKRVKVASFPFNVLFQLEGKVEIVKNRTRKKKVAPAVVEEASREEKKEEKRISKKDISNQIEKKEVEIARNESLLHDLPDIIEKLKEEKEKLHVMLSSFDLV